MNKKAVSLFSGGLDSILATRLMVEHGIEVHALNFSSVFCASRSKNGNVKVIKTAQDLGVPIKVMDITREFMEIVKSPRYGRGRNMNPCIDCRIFSFKKAGHFMKDIGASFIVTGEVLGERPMSQTKNSIELIEKKSGLEGLIVRPLSARLLKPSIPEEMGIVKRDNLLDIHGRKRERQIKLAESFDIKDYPNASGGCLLTDRGFSHRLKDLLQYNVDCDINDLELLKIGRQFRIRDTAKLFVGRNEKENTQLLSFSSPGDYIFDVLDYPSPIGLVRGSVGEEDMVLAASIMARYSDATSECVKVSYRISPSEELRYISVKPAVPASISSIRI